MRFRRKTRLAAAAASASLVTLGIVAAPQAAFASTPCPDGQICFYKDAHGQGAISIQKTLSSTQSGIRDFRNSHYSDGTSLNDSVSSIINNTAGCLYVYKDVNFGPDGFASSFLIIPHSGIEAGRLFPNDAISSALVFPQPCNFH